MRNSVIAAVSAASLAALAVSSVAFERAQFPPALHWTDRRPIASLVIGTAAAGWPTNPRGWFLDREVNVTTEAGIAAFQQRLLAWADSSIAIMRQANAQGMITWDIEGEQFPHKTTYIGDPRIVNNLAPEMTDVADLYFQRFRDAGFRVGVTIRPQQLDVTTVDVNMATQREVSDPAALIIEKIRYARRRWGASLFYIDSNANGYIPMNPAVFAHVATAVPGILLIPEHSDFRYYGSTAPYGALRKGFTGTGALSRLLYPESFSVIDTADGLTERNYTAVYRAVAHGDILLFRGWFPAPETPLVRKLLVQKLM